MRVNQVKFAGQKFTATYETADGVKVGDAVIADGNGKVKRGAGVPIGIVTGIEDDGHATVLLYGEITTVTTATLLTPGYQGVTADASGRLAAPNDPADDPQRGCIVHASQTTSGVHTAAVTLL